MSIAKYFGCRVIQRDDVNTPPFFSFYAQANDIVQWAGVRRIAELPKGTQRILRKTRTNAIRRFLGANTINTIPNSLLIAFLPGIVSFRSVQGLGASSPPEADIANGCGGKLTWGFIEFAYSADAPEYDKPALVVDGQHRLFGVRSYTGEAIPLLVVGILDAPPEEQAFQFIVVNNKAVRVPTENVKSIVADIGGDVEDALNMRLEMAGVKYGKAAPMLRDVNSSEESPFYRLLDWAHNREGQRVVPVTTIESSVKYIQQSFESLLRDDDDSTLAVFYAIWRPIKRQYSQLWAPESQFMNKVNLVALNEYVVDNLRTLWAMDLCDILDPDEVAVRVVQLLKGVPADFWTTKWQIKIQDNATVRGFIKNDIERITENSKLERNWKQDLKLIEFSEEEHSSDQPTA